LALVGGGWLTAHPGHFTPGNDLVTTVKEVVKVPWKFWMSEENRAPAGI